MPSFCIVGSSTLLQKSLPHFLTLFPNQVVAVFLQLDTDTEAIKICKEHGLNYFDISELKQANTEPLINYQFDYLFNINSTLILSPEQLSLARIANLNLHPGKLPEYAGLHTHQWAIRNGETQFGVTLHYMEAGIDTGDIALQSLFEIGEKETGLSLFLKCMQHGALLVQHALEMIAQNLPLPKLHQNHEVRRLYTHKMAKEAFIDLQGSARHALDLIRAADYAPFQSPTYVPKVQLDSGIMYTTKASIPDEYPTFEGKFHCNEKGLYIQFFDGVLLITRVLNMDGKKIDPETLKSLFN